MSSWTPSPQASMTHIAISEHRDGASVQWMEKVKAGQYGVPPVSGEGPPTSPQLQLASPPAQPGSGRPSGPLQQKLAPAMAALADDVLYGDVWRRPELSPRDRSLVESGLTRDQIVETVTHLAFHAGWSKATKAMSVIARTVGR